MKDHKTVLETGVQNDFTFCLEPPIEKRNSKLREENPPSTKRKIHFTPKKTRGIFVNFYDTTLPFPLHIKT